MESGGKACLLYTSDKNGSVFDLGLVYFAGFEFYLTFQIDVSCGQDSFIKVRSEERRVGKECRL